MTGYKIIQALIRFFLLFVFRVKVYGKENVPKEGGVMFTINHRSNWDVLLVGANSPRKLNFMAKSELFKNKLFGKLISALGAYPIKRGQGDLGAVKATMATLRSGNAVAMFPEGKRVRNNERVDPKPGAVMLAVRTQIPIVPVRIEGGFKWFSKINVYFGTPIEYSQYHNEKVMIDTLQELSNELMKRIRTMNVENYNQK